MQEQTIKHLLSQEYFSLSASLGVEEAIACIRQYDNSSLHEYYLTDVNQILCGRYALHAENNKEEVARLFRQHSCFSLPVVNAQQQLVGIITYADGMNILIEEDQEDIERMMGIAGEGNAVAYRLASSARTAGVCFWFDTNAL